MAGLVPLPETVVHSSTRLTHREAHDMLSSFLEIAETNPAYRPDAVLTQHGPQAAGVGAGSNLTLTHLKRILDGIEGKRIGRLDFNLSEPENKKRKFEGDGGFTSSPPAAGSQDQYDQSKSRKNTEHIQEMADGDTEGQAALVADETDGWQDKEEFELAQVDETEDLGDRDPADPGDGADGQVGRRNIDHDIATVTAGGLSKSDKAARKKAKKGRREQEKRDKEAKKRRPAD